MVNKLIFQGLACCQKLPSNEKNKFYLYEFFLVFFEELCNSPLHLCIILSICVHKCQILEFRLQEGRKLNYKDLKDRIGELHE